ncbi:translation initiation factor eIF3 subunit, partial [Coemansia sp. S16]
VDGRPFGADARRLSESSSHSRNRSDSRIHIGPSARAGGPLPHKSALSLRRPSQQLGSPLLGGNSEPSERSKQVRFLTAVPSDLSVDQAHLTELTQLLSLFEKAVAALQAIARRGAVAVDGSQDSERGSTTARSQAIRGLAAAFLQLSRLSSSTGLVRHYDKPTLAQFKATTQAGHERPLTQIKYNRDGDLLMTVSKDKVANLWYSHNGEHIGCYIGHLGALWTIDCNKTSTLVITGAADNTARLWHAETGRMLHTWELPTAVKRVEFSHDDQYVLMVTEERMGHKSGIYVFAIDISRPEQSNEPIVILRASGAKPTVAAWSFLDKFIVSGHEDGTLSLYDWRNEVVVETAKAHEGIITDMQMWKDGTYFITSSRDMTARLFETATLQAMKEYKTDAPLNTATMTPTQDLVILGGGQAASEVTTTSSRQGKFESRFFHKIFEDEVGRSRGHFGPINTLAVQPDGKGFASGGEDGLVRVHHFDPDYFKFKYDY